MRTTSLRSLERHHAGGVKEFAATVVQEDMLVQHEKTDKWLSQQNTASYAAPGGVLHRIRGGVPQARASGAARRLPAMF